MSQRNVSIGLVVMLIATILVACAAPGSARSCRTCSSRCRSTCSPAADQPMRTYYMISSHQAHPYFADSHLALRYAADYFKVNIIAAGPDGWDTKAQADAIEPLLLHNPTASSPVCGMTPQRKQSRRQWPPAFR